MHKLPIPSWIAVMILGIFLTACSPVPDPETRPAQVRTIEPSAPKTTPETSVQSESSTIQNNPSVDTSPSHTAPKNSEPLPSSDNGQSASERIAAEQKVDIDLTGFSTNMLYAEVYNIEMSPEAYKGKIIKLTGEFARFPKDIDENGNPTSDEEIFVCIISDAMACCATGIEFIPEKESSFWTNYPEDGSKITITGLCDIFLDESGWFTIVQLDNATVQQSN